MSKLDELIKKLCPDGVEYKRLGEIVKIKNGCDYKHLQEGNIPVYGSGGIINYVNEFQYDKPSVLIPRKGSLDKLYYVDTPFWNVDTIFYTIIDTSIVFPKFLYFVLQKAHLENLNKAGGVPSLTQSALNKVSIPIPPLEVQREIVNILDNFTELTAELIAELTAELTARKKQYEYYRNRLLTFDSKDISLFKLQDVVEIQRGIRVTRNQLSNDGKYPVYQNSLVPMGYYNDKNREANSTFLICAGAAGDIGYSTQSFWAADDCYTFDCSDKILNRYLFYVLKNKQVLIYSRVRRASVPRISKESIGTIKVPVPEISVQERIVNVLDNFDKVCNDLHIGLPAEIEARKKQYEFYRDSLLTFLEKGESILTEQNRTELRYALIKLLQYVFGYVWLPLSTISENLDSYRKPIKQGNRMKGIYPYYGASGIVDYVKDYIFDGNFLLVSEDGANLLARVTPIAFSISGKNWVNNHAHVLKFHDLYMQKYVEFYLNFLDLQSIISGAAQPKLTKNSLDKIKIPVPDEVVLKRIVSTLERFDTLCHDISSGLPAEIEARKKQYEYYRDKLLSFKEKKG